MYRIVEFSSNGTTVYIVYNVVKGKELGRYNTYHEAFLYIRGL
jgi:hypothetical protein